MVYEILNKANINMIQEHEQALRAAESDDDESDDTEPVGWSTADSILKFFEEFKACPKGGGGADHKAFLRMQVQSTNRTRLAFSVLVWSALPGLCLLMYMPRLPSQSRAVCSVYVFVLAFVQLFVLGCSTCLDGTHAGSDQTLVLQQRENLSQHISVFSPTERIYFTITLIL